ncbi:ABC-type antimicrobial peptide transport system permease subunit [Silvibacterium bohemicum]|uniref:ABC-type antimicrobial peptide transport system permease subunit n=1 Tax=Silvibacterium bohemicum TaxID=1577686 RepID=A0A841JY10_9BACT|nr:ABC transporter permease [Silvibacterium bohemicum]MBB6144619.1 ABC-type antimicrobial peptide transport system permease subunit [Silvibacterium bohemicum]
MLRKLQILFRRDRFSRDLEEEMAFHRAEAAKQFESEGMSVDEARYAAARQFGNMTRLQERSHEMVGFRWESVVQDLVFAIRQLRKNPGFTVTAILMLALGIGVNVAIFAFVDAALIKPLPYENPSRLAVLFESIPVGPRFHLSYLDYLDWKKSNQVFSSLDIYSVGGFILSTPEGTQQTQGASISAGFFRTLGVTPILGRDFGPEEDQSAAPRTTLLSYAAWQKRYGGRRDVVGKTVTLDGNPTTIIGVLPRDFHFAPAEPAEFWATTRASGNCEKNRGCHDFFGIARLKDGVSSASALANLKDVEGQLERQYPDTNRDRLAFMLPLTEVIVGDIRPILLVLLSGAGLLLLIATVNVASLLLVRSESRRREISVRGALGASRARLVGQFAIEGVALVTAGTTVGIAFAWSAMRLLAGAIALFMSVFFSVTPALRLSLSDLRDGLAEGSRGSSGVIWRRFGAHLVVVELATAMVLLMGAGLLGKSFYRLLHVDTGVQPEHVAAIQAAATGNAYSTDAQQIALERELATRISSLPGVKSVAFASQLPLGDGDGIKDFRIVGRSFHGERYETVYREVSAGYFSVLQTKLLRGRYFTDAEDESQPRVVVVNEQMARQYFPDEDPIGKQISVDASMQKKSEIIGVVSDIQEGQLDAAPRAAMYIPFNQDPTSEFAVIVRTSQAEESSIPLLDVAIHKIDPSIATFGGITMTEKIHDSPSSYLHRSSAWLVGGFAAFALLLGVVGLYGVIAYSVSQRTREIGVRMALGAQKSGVYRLILFEAGWLAVIGIALGGCCSVFAGMLMQKLLFQVHSWDVPTLAGVAAVLALAAAAASYLPARRAASVNPVDALRAE